MNETPFASEQPIASETEYLLQWHPPEEIHPMFEETQRRAFSVAFAAISRVCQIDRALAGQNDDGTAEEQPWLPTRKHLERAKILSRAGLRIARHQLELIDRLSQAKDFDQRPLSLPWLTAHGFVAAPVLADAAGVKETVAERQFAEQWFASIIRYEDGEPVRYYGTDAVEFTSSAMLVPHTAALRQLHVSREGLRLILEHLDLPAVRHAQKDQHFSSVEDIAAAAEALERLPLLKREDLTIRALATELGLADTRRIVNFYKQRQIPLELRRLELANGMTTIVKVISPEKAQAFGDFLKTGTRSIRDIIAAAGLATTVPLVDYLRPEEVQMIEKIPPTPENPNGNRCLSADIAEEIIARIRAQHEDRALPGPTTLPAHLVPFSVIKQRFAYPDAGLQRMLREIHEPQLFLLAGEEAPCYPWRAIKQIEQHIESRSGEITLDYQQLPEGPTSTKDEKYARSVQAHYLEELKPPTFMHPLAAIAKEIKIPVAAAVGFLKDFGGEVRTYFTDDGEEGLFTTELGAQLLRRQRMTVSDRPLPPGWQRRDQIAEATGLPVSLFDRWVNHHPEFLHRTEWRKRQDIENPPSLPYFPPAVIEQFILDVGKEA